MPASYNKDVILAPPSMLRPGEVDRLNTILHEAGLGRPLGPPEPGTSAVAVLPVSEADPQNVVATLRQAAAEHGEDLLYASRDFTYDVDTVAHGQHGHDLVASDHKISSASGKKSGHGTVSWLPVPPEEMPDAPPWSPAGTPPIIAVLDSGVRPHTWLPSIGNTPEFLLEPPEWTVQIDQPDMDHLGGYFGHATFLAGLLRLQAAKAQVLSLPVMKDDGTVRERDIIGALDWLITHKKDYHALGVVLMAFGRPRVKEDNGPTQLKEKIRQLGELGVTIVASAGNNGSKEPTMPASLSADQPHVVSVGAGNSKQVHALYSNHGDWVQQWRCGTDMISLMPIRLFKSARENPQFDANGYAQWSGTSFSAAIYAAELAQAHAAEWAAGTGPYHSVRVNPGQPG